MFCKNLENISFRDLKHLVIDILKTSWR